MRRSALILASAVALAAHGVLRASDVEPQTTAKAVAPPATRPASAEHRLAAVERQLEALLKEVRELREAAAAPVEQQTGDQQLVIIRLKNARAATAADALKGLFRRAGVGVIVDDRTNSLLVQGREAGISDVRAALGYVDAPDRK